VSWRLARELLFVFVIVAVLQSWRFCWGSFGRGGDVDVVVGAGISADVTAPSRPCLVFASLHIAGVEASWLRVAVSPGHAREWAKVLLTWRVERLYPTKPRVERWSWTSLSARFSSPSRLALELRVLLPSYRRHCSRS
jgi:hypothetical protein